MVDQRPARSRGLLKPVLGGIALIAAVVAIIYFRAEIWSALKWLFRTFGDWLTEWVPNHPGQSSAIIGFAVLAFVVNWLAHVRGRLRAWVFAIVVEIGLWFLFWYGAGIPSLNELFGLDIEKMDFRLALTSGLIVIAVTGVIFWFLELREEWKKYRHSTDPD
jgi:hypothetical protein